MKGKRNKVALGMGIAIIVAFGIISGISLFNAQVQQGIMDNNIQWEQMWGYIESGDIPPEAPLYNDITTGHEAYQTALAAYKNVILLSIIFIGITSAAGASLGTGILVYSKTKKDR